MASKIVCYTQDGIKEVKEKTIKDAGALKDCIVWVDLSNPSKTELVEIQETYGLHPLAIDDCMHDVQRPKIEIFDNHFFLIAHHVVYDKKVQAMQIGMFVGDNYVVTIHKNGIELMDAIRESMVEGDSQVSKSGPDYLLYKIIDKVVDNYFTILDAIQDDIEVIEAEVIKKPGKAVLKKLFKTKRNLLMLRKPVWPLREVMNILQSGSIKNVSKKNMPYFKDIYDHVINVIDLIETYRELISASLETYMSSVSNQLNEVMKVLTVISSLVLFPTLIASIYGMNFKVMPELSWEYGYPMAIGIMLASMAVMFIYFRKKNWI